MMRHRGLVKRERVGEIADADFLRRASERRQHAQPVRVAEGLEKRRLLLVGIRGNLGRWTAPLHRHLSMLSLHRRLSILLRSAAWRLD